MAAKFLVVPEWQGSASSRSMRLIDGAEAIRGDLPSAATVTVEIPLGAGDAVGSGVHRYSSLAVVRERLAEALQQVADSDVPIVIGGDCGVELAAVEHALAAATRRGSRLGIVWFDAHPDLNSPATSPSGAFSGMVLRALLGDGVPGLVADPRLDPASVVLAGARSLDDGEAEYLAESPIVRVDADAVGAGLGAVLDPLGFDEVYVHVDLDVLDPAEFGGVPDPQPFGVATADLTAAIGAALAGRRLAGAAITMFAPPSPEAAGEELAPILRILSALTAGTR
ncbi:MAG TPA: arginase family protein [Amnibacterium sp.]|jgi:arginase|nr:arginase family protein [Amnibacterium sp.]